TTTLQIGTLAGSGAPGSDGDGGSALAATLNFPTGVAVDTSGNIYIADTSNHRIRKVASNGVITPVAGTGTAGFSGEAVDATTAMLNEPGGLAVDGSGNLYIAD